MLHVTIAIEYPSLYREEANWFQTTALIKVVDELSVSIPKYSQKPHDSTHLFLMPKNTAAKIETNRQTRLKLGYSQQSVFDYSKSASKADTSSQIISLENDELIRTHDKYGKVTVIIEEGQGFSDQVVMLNVLVTDIFSIATMF